MTFTVNELFYEFINFSERIYHFSILSFEKTNLIEFILLVCDCVLLTLDIEVKRLSLQWKRMFSFVEIYWYYWNKWSYLNII